MWNEIIIVCHPLLLLQQASEVYQDGHKHIFMIMKYEFIIVT